MRQTSVIVKAQFLDIRDVDPAAFDDDQSLLRQLMQYAREVLLRQIEARGDHSLVGRQGDGDRFLRVAGLLPQQVADDSLATRVQRVRFHVGDQVVQTHRQAGDHLATELGVAVEFLDDRRLRNVQQQ